METFCPFCLGLRRLYDSACDSDFRFSGGHKRSYDSDPIPSLEKTILNSRGCGLGKICMSDGN